MPKYLKFPRAATTHLHMRQYRYWREVWDRVHGISTRVHRWWFFEYIQWMVFQCHVDDWGAKMVDKLWEIGKGWKMRKYCWMAEADSFLEIGEWDIIYDERLLKCRVLILKKGGKGRGLGDDGNKLKQTQTEKPTKIRSRDLPKTSFQYNLTEKDLSN